MLLQATNFLVDASVILCHFSSCIGTTPECPDEQLIKPKSLVDFRAARTPVLLLTKTKWFSLTKWFSFRF